MVNNREEKPPFRASGWLDRIIYFCLTHRLLVVLCTAFLVFWGIAVAPFDWEIPWLLRSPVPVDAIPDIGENQQIVFTQWPGRSPQDVEDQVSYPLTVAMLGIPGVKTVRSYSMFGFSSIYVIFKEDVEFYWSRTRVLEKLNSFSSDLLPDGVAPTLGPDSTALGQVFWYTLEGIDSHGRNTGGWDMQELRSIQDWYVRYALLSADGISEVASIGGYVKEYQIDVDPDAMLAFKVSLNDIFKAVRESNLDVGARTIEVNKAEYVIRGLGFIKSVEDIENTVILVRENVPVYIRNIANVSLGPALRRGALDKGGAETVGGVAVVRYGENPLSVIKALKHKIREISPGMPERIMIDRTKSQLEIENFSKAQGFNAYLPGGQINQKDWISWWNRTPAATRPQWVNLSKVTIVPFYDRTRLIHETLGTLNSALIEEILVTVIVILIMVMHLRSSVVISCTLPLAVLICFICMKLFRVDANVVALSGIAIAIGTIVDMGVIVCENILRHLEENSQEEDRILVVFHAVSEVGSAVLTAILTTIVSFLPVFTMTGAEGKLFKPLAYTKTFALVASVVVALTIVPVIAHTLFTFSIDSRRFRVLAFAGIMLCGTGLCFTGWWWLGAILLALGLWNMLLPVLPSKLAEFLKIIANITMAVLVGIILTYHWLPLGPAAGLLPNAIIVLGPVAFLLLFFTIFARFYTHLLRWCLDHKLLFLSVPALLCLTGPFIWLGADTLLGALPDSLKEHPVYRNLAEIFPGLNKEFMPDLDEGSFLYMPTTMPHASIGEVLDVLHKQDMAFGSIPEIENVVGKLGRAETPLDPAPISMIETVINYKQEYLLSPDGHRLLFRHDPKATDFFRDPAGTEVSAQDGRPYKVRGKFIRDAENRLVTDPEGAPFRLWRPALDPGLNPGREKWSGIRSPADIWNEILRYGEVPGTTSAPKLQPIKARIVMLQSGMRAPMGIKVKGPDLKTIDAFSLKLEKLLKEMPGVEPSAVIADRIVGKPYLEIDVNRKASARYGISVGVIQNIIEIAIGGKKITSTVEGRERYPVRVRYKRELRDTIEGLQRILVPGADGQQIPLSQLAEIRYVRGPQVIKSEDTFLVGYVLFDKKEGFSEVNVVESCQKILNKAIKERRLILPAGVSYTFSGNYENQIRATRTLSLILPLALFIIFLILYLQFDSLVTTGLVFSGILVAWSGGFWMIWLYGQDWFLDFRIFEINLRDLFQIHTVNLSVAIWVGFLALFGIASDDGVVMATYLKERFDKESPVTLDAIRQTTIDAARRRIRPCLMTTATTILALLPILTASGRGSDIMIPMAIPSFGGMIIEIMTMLVVPVMYCLWKEITTRKA